MENIKVRIRKFKCRHSLVCVHDKTSIIPGVWGLRVL